LDGTIATADLANSAVTDEKIAGVAGSKVSGNITGNAANVTGTVAVVNGGTGATALTGLVKGNGTGIMTAAVVGTDYQAPLALTTTGSGAATLTGATLNIPSLAPGTTPGDMLYWNGTAWVKVAAGIENQTLTFIGGKPVWSYFYNISRNLPPNSVYNPMTDRIWMDRNLGASQVATSSTDAASYGDLYQWGRGTDGHQIRTSGTTATLSGSNQPGNGNFITINSGNYDWRSSQNNNLWQGVAGVNNPCPSGHSIPTAAEWEAERLSWNGGNNAAGAFASPLKLPMAGIRDASGSVYNVGTFGYYWSSTVNFPFASILSLESNDAYSANSYRAFGMSVRCIMD
jgi:uncharacterized protein (TIGR02145 family)